MVSAIKGNENLITQLKWIFSLLSTSQQKFANVAMVDSCVDLQQSNGCNFVRCKSNCESPVMYLHPRTRPSQGQLLHHVLFHDTPT